MTGLVQSTRIAESVEPGEVSDSTEPIPVAAQAAGRPHAVAGAGWRAVGWLACGVAGLLLITWFILLSPGELGSKAEWFFGAGVLSVVMVSMWQTHSIQRQAHRAVAEATDRLRTELAANESRMARELALTQSLHRAELDAQRKLQRAELEAYRELARAEHSILVRQLDKYAMTEVSRAVGALTQMLATLWNQGASILRIEDRDEREAAMNPIFEQITRVVNDFSVELGNAYSSIDDERLHQALDKVNEATLMAVAVAEEMHRSVVDGSAPESNPIPPVQRLMQTRAAEARSLAWKLLRTGLDDSVAASKVNSRS